MKTNFNYFSSNLKAFLMLLCFVSMAGFSNAAVSTIPDSATCAGLHPSPSCSIIGPLKACLGEGELTDSIVIDFTDNLNNNPKIQFSFTTNQTSADVGPPIQTSFSNFEWKGYVKVSPGITTGTFTLFMDVFVFYDDSCTMHGTASLTTTIVNTGGTAEATPIACFGGTSTVTITPSGQMAAYTFTQLPSGPTNSSGIFPGLKGGLTASGDSNYCFKIAGTIGALECDTVVCITIHQPANVPVDLHCANDTTVSSCQTTQQIATEFQAWLDRFSHSGGVNPVFKRTPASPTPPPVCGGTTTVIDSLYSDCSGPLTCTSHFTVTASPALVIHCAHDTTAASCQSQAAIDLAYNAWLKTAFGTGGCGPKVTNNGGSTGPNACGGNKPVTFTLTDTICTSNPSKTCSATFTVAAGPTKNFHCANDTTIAAGQSQAAVQAAFDAWILTAKASGGCNGVLTNSHGPAPDACGGTTPVTFKYKTDCDSTLCTANFKVNTCQNTCAECNGQTIVVDQNVTIDFSGAIPVYNGDPDLQPYFSYDISGATKDLWNAIFNVGGNKLLIKSGATITTYAPGGYAPGIILKGTCDFEEENGAHIIVNSQNKTAGSIQVLFTGNIIVNGEIRDEVSGTIGLPGCITVASKCGTLNVGITGQILDLGIDAGGCGITLLACGNGGENRDITVSGLVKAYAHAHAGNQNLNRPNIKVVALNGGVTINANSNEPLYDEFQSAGTKYDIYGGLLSWVRDNARPGKVEVQAKNDIIVNGHGIDPTGPVRTSFGAIAAIATASDAPGGMVDVRSLEGRIIADNRAFDVSGRNRLPVNYAHINLYAKLNISLTRSGINNNYNPVVDASSPSVGDKGGVNELRSYSGGIVIGLNALVSAAVPAGNGTVQGVNLLTSCTGVIKTGAVTPADLVAGDDIGICAPVAPTALYTSCEDLGGKFRLAGGDAPMGSMLFYPNPSQGFATLQFNATEAGIYGLQVVDMTGRILFTGSIAAQEGENSSQLDLTHIAKGIYVLILRNADNKLEQRIVLQ